MHHWLGYLMCFILVFITCSDANTQRSEKQLDSYYQCDEDGDCKAKSENSLCIDNNVDHAGWCTCKKEYVMQRNRTYFECLQVINNTVDSCTADIQCETHFGNRGFCSSGKCACRSGAHMYNNKCYKTARLNEICEVNENCLLKDNEIAFCTDGKCQCDDRIKHQYVDDTGESCELTRQLGQNCTKDGECSLTEYSRCVGVCKCKPGYTTDFKQVACMEAATYIGDRCTTDDQCDGIDNSNCEIGKCICRRGFHAHNNICYKDVALGNACQNVAECVIQAYLRDRVNCTEGVCACTTGYSEKDRSCEPNSANQTATTWILSAVLYSLILLFNK